MTGRERILKAISHEEADRVPIDLGSCLATSINVKAYAALLDLLGYQKKEIKYRNILTQVAVVEKDIIKKFSIDTFGVFPKKIFKEDFYRYKDGKAVCDEWGIQWYMPNKEGHYYDMISHPLKNSSLEDIQEYEWVKGDNPSRFSDMEPEIDNASELNNAIVLGEAVGNGILQTGNWLEGFEDFLCDLAMGTKKAELIMDKVLEIKMAYFKYALENYGSKIDIVYDRDDLGTQSSLIISPELYRKYIKPRQKTLFSYIKKLAPHIKIIFHSCGSIKSLISDFIDIGADALNPVQISAVDMDPKELKKEYGEDIAFWGGGIDTQNRLSTCTPDEVGYDIRKNLEIFAPGGGYVFAQVHSIQEEVPPENIIRMWETVLKYGGY